MRFFTAGESHGRSLIAFIEGVPAGISITSDDIRRALARRRLGLGRGKRMAFEQDEVTILSGIRHGLSMGSPIAIEIGNTEWPKWTTAMSPDPVDGESKSELTRPRPGHADLAAMAKYGFENARPSLERSSARETAARVACGEIAKAFIRQVSGIEVLSHVVQLGSARNEPATRPVPSDLAAIDADPARVFGDSSEFVEAVEKASADKETLGGVVEVLAYGVPVGLGSYSQWDTRLDGRIAGALMSIQACKGVEIGEGFGFASLPGSQAHDPIVLRDGQLGRTQNNAGGIEGGISNGQVLWARAAMKPIPTVPVGLPSVDLSTMEPSKAHYQRSDITAVPAFGVVAEAMLALVLADALHEKLGGDSLSEIRRNLQSYEENLAWPVEH
jgi:chorismate synthase